MAKQLAAIHNHTDRTFILSRVASGGRALFVIGAAPGPVLGRGNYPINLEIPDNSDCQKYFETNHMRLDLTDPVTKATQSFSFWDDDWKNFQIYFCEGENWQAGFKLMRGLSSLWSNACSSDGIDEESSISSGEGSSGSTGFETGPFCWTRRKVSMEGRI